jgi:hypothetical protein
MIHMTASVADEPGREEATDSQRAARAPLRACRPLLASALALRGFARVG